MQDISMVQIILVTLVAFLAGCDSVLDERMFYRPIIACTLTGLALGDPKTGIMVGGALELLGPQQLRAELLERIDVLMVEEGSPDAES